MDTLPLPPVAGPFIQSLRNIGYSLESAVADVVDNSISAHATTIDIFTEWRNSDPILAVMDNGNGMRPEEIQSAMQLGAVGPANLRSNDDLGRFGMGLKTASFSQCKILTLISRSDENDNWYGLRWDLDIVESENQWLVEVIEHRACQEVLKKIDFQFSTGTAVIWNNFDRAIDPTATNGEKDYNRRMAELLNHLGLTFHRFIKGDEVPRAVRLRLNKRPIEAKDPFAIRPEANKQASILLSNESIRLGECSVRIRAYLLPHPSNFSHSFASRVSPNGDHHTGQGVYIYRSGRLIVSGGWHRLAKMSEANKLARIQVDFGNDADTLWKIDVRKSHVDLPASLREQLRRIILQCSKKSSSTFSRRASIPSVDIEPVWIRTYDRESSRVHYVLNRKHSVFSKMPVKNDFTTAKSVLLKLIETSLPVGLIKNDISVTDVNIGYEESDLLKRCEELAQELFVMGLDQETVYKALINDSNIGLTAEHAKHIVAKLK